MDSFDENGCWEFSDYATLIYDYPRTDLDWINPSDLPEFDCSPATGAVLLGQECAEKECPRKRGRNESCSRNGAKACRERQRRENLNNRFLELSSTLELGRPATTDKSAIIGDAIRVLNQLKTESQEYKKTNERLQEEIRSLKAEKNELRKEKHALKAEKSKIEQQLKTMTMSSTGFIPTHPAAAFPAGPNNMPVFPSYSYVPMWHYLPPSVCDTSHDHELRPPAA